MMIVLSVVVGILVFLCGFTLGHYSGFCIGMEKNGKNEQIQTQASRA